MNDSDFVKSGKGITNSRSTTAGFRCGAETDIYSGKIAGVIRASMGAMTTIGDVEAFIAFINEFYVENSVPLAVERLSNIDESGKLSRPQLLSLEQLETSTKIMN